jgi:DNA invertase Pin-like site-specific DNA recombinase
MQEYRPTARALTLRRRNCAPPEPRSSSAKTGSGAKTDRAQLRRVLDQLAEGDVLMVTRLDQIREAVTRRANGEPVREIARSYAVHHSTISRLQGHG